MFSSLFLPSFLCYLFFQLGCHYLWRKTEARNNGKLIFGLLLYFIFLAMNVEFLPLVEKLFSQLLSKMKPSRRVTKLILEFSRFHRRYEQISNGFWYEKSKLFNLSRRINNLPRAKCYWKPYVGVFELNLTSTLLTKTFKLNVTNSKRKLQK